MSSVQGNDLASAGQVFIPQLKILSAMVSPVASPKAAAVVASWAAKHEAHVVCAANVHMLMEAVDDPSFGRDLAQADLLVCDGRPLVWAARLLGHANARQCRGLDLLLAVCERAAEEGLKVGLYGAEADVNEAVRHRLTSRFSGIDVAYAWSPPFRELTPDEDEGVVRMIAGAGVQILFVSLGCPRQERWMTAHRDTLPCTMLGVGAAFDMVAAKVPVAPRWIQRAGLEWAFRLMREPRRLWRRYAKHNARFAALVALQVLRERIDA